MTPEGHNDLNPRLQLALRAADRPLTFQDLYDMPDIRAVAPSPNRVSDYLGVMFRRGLVSRVRMGSGGDDASSRARWGYVWKDKKTLGQLDPHLEVKDFKPKALLDRPNIYIAEDGAHISIELPGLSILIKKT
jgi:hypothetical protein